MTGPITGGTGAIIAVTIGATGAITGSIVRASSVPIARNARSDRTVLRDRTGRIVPIDLTGRIGRIGPIDPIGRIDRTARDGAEEMVRSSLLSAVWIVVMLPTAGQAQDERWQVGTAPSFSTGRFGTDTRTEVLHTATTARRLFDDGDLTLVLPVTCIWGNGTVTVVNGTPVRTEQASRTSDGSRQVRDAGSVTLRPGSGVQPLETRSCGMGDIVVRGRYYLVDERGWKPTVAVRGHVKAPTASAERGLGTGRPDEGIGLEVSRTLAGGVLAMVDGGYTIIGDADAVDFNNNWWYDVGIGRNVANGAVNLSVFFEEYRALVRGLVNARDVLAAVSVKGTNGWRVQVAGQFGLSDGAPERGLTLGASRRF